MSTHERLAGCFAAVFPLLSADETLEARTDALDEWDSIASVTLFTLVEEEFEVQVPDDALEQLISYQAILDWLDGLPRTDPV